MTTPANGKKFAGRSTSSTFSGYLFDDYEYVQVQASLPPDGAWVTIGGAYSDTTPFTNEFDTDLYRWQTPPLTIPLSRWEAGARGYRTHVRARQQSANQVLVTFDSTELTTYSCLQSSDDWYDFEAECLSHASPVVTIETNDFVPRITRGRTDCSYATDAECSPCGPNLPFELYQPQIDIEHADGTFRLRSGAAGLIGNAFQHVQGVARLRDIVVENGTYDYRIGRIVESDNVWPNGLAYFQHLGISPTQDAVFQGLDGNLIGRPEIAAHFDHPSGMQAHGDVVALAMEGRRSTPTVYNSYRDPELSSGTTAAIYFLRYSGMDDAAGELVNVLELDGSQVDLPPSETPGASAAAFVQLEDGHFLAAASANNHGRAGVWFYYSDRTEIVWETQWRLVDFWEPPCTSSDGGSDSLETCYGGSAGMALLTDCTGAIYLLSGNGTDTTGFSDEYQWTQVHRVVQTSTGAVDLWFSSWQRDNTGLTQTNNPAFRWSMGTYMSESGLPVIFNTERRTNDRGTNENIDGDLYYRAEAAGLLFSPTMPLEPEALDRTAELSGHAAWMIEESAE